MRIFLSVVLLSLLFHVESAAQQRMIKYSVTFEWVDEKEKRIVDSFEGGGRQYSYEQLIHKKLDRIDSVVIWTNGIREFVAGFDLNEYGQGEINTPEESDTLWFYARSKKVAYYHDHQMMQGSSRHFTVYFTENPHNFIRHGFFDMPFDLDFSLYYVYRDYLICPFKDDQKWLDFANRLMREYPGVVLYINIKELSLNFFGKSDEYKRALLREITASDFVSIVSPELKNIVHNKYTHFIQPGLTIYTDRPSEEVSKAALKYGFSSQLNQSGGTRYDLKYVRGKLLGSEYILNCSRLIRAVSAKYGSNDYFYEVMLD